MRISLFSHDALIARAGRHFKLQLSLYLKIILVMMIGLFIITLIDSAASVFLNDALSPYVKNFAQVISVNIFYKSAIWILIFLWFAFTQGLMIHTSLDDKKQTLRQIIAHFRQDYGRFILLSLILLIIGGAVLLPFYGFGIVMVLNFPLKGVVAALLLLLFVVVIVACLWALMFAPFIMLDLHCNIKITLKNGIALVRHKFGKIIQNMIIPFLIIILLNLIMGALPANLAALVSLIYIFLVMPWLYSYIAVLYRQLKNA